MLQVSEIDIDLAQGLETQVDKKLVEGKNLLLENASFNKFGSLSKSNGYSQMTMDIAGGGSLSGKVKKIFNIGKNIVAITSDRLFYAYYPQADNWRLMDGAKFPAKIESFDLNYAGNTQNLPDISYNSDLDISATVYEETDINDQAVYLAIRDHSTDYVASVRVAVESNSPRVQIMEDSGSYKIFVIYNNYGGLELKYKFYDLELNQLSSGTIGIIPSKRPVNIDYDGSNILFFYPQSSDLEYGTISFSGTVTTNSFTPTNSYGLGIKGLIAKYVDGEIWLAWINGSDALIFKAYESDLTTVSIAEVKLKTYGSSHELLKVDFVKTSTNVYFFNEIEITGATVLDSLTRNIECLVYDTAVSTLSATHTAFNCFLQSRVFYESTSEKFYSLLSYNSELQKTNYFCELEITQKDSQNIIYPHVLANTTKGLASGYQSATGSFVPSNVPTKIVFADNKFFIPAERTRQFTDAENPLFDQSSIEHLVVDINDFKIDYDDFGNSVLLAAGIVLETEGVSVLENGFLLNPERVEVSETGTGDIEAGTRAYAVVFEYYNSKGELTRSAPCLTESITQSGANTENTINVELPLFGQKMNDRCKIILYRTINAGTIYYRLNRYEVAFTQNPFSTFIPYVDSVADADIQANEILYTDGGELPNDSAPQATSIVVGERRAILAGLKRSSEVGYSKLSVFEIAPSFSDFYRIDTDAANFSESGKVFGVGFLDSRIILFQENSIYVVSGTGPENNGLNDDYTAPESISDEVGCIEPKSIINLPAGMLFKSTKGFYLLDRSLQLSYIGNSVNDFNQYEIVSSFIIESSNEVKFFTNDTYVLTYHYLLNQWSVDTYEGDEAFYINNSIYHVDNGDVYKQSQEFTRDSSFYSLKLRTPWLKLNTLAGFQRIKRAIVTGNYISPHTLVMRVYYNYDESTYEEHTISVSSESVYQLQAHIAQQKCTSIMFEIFDNPVSGGESMELNKLTIQVGLKKGTAKSISSKRF